MTFMCTYLFFRTITYNEEDDQLYGLLFPDVRIDNMLRLTDNLDRKYLRLHDYPISRLTNIDISIVSLKGYVEIWGVNSFLVLDSIFENLKPDFDVFVRIIFEIIKACDKHTLYYLSNIKYQKVIINAA